MCPSSTPAEMHGNDTRLDTPFPEFPEHVLSTPRPLLRREGIRWDGGIGGKPLRIMLTLENRSARSTSPMEARLEIAAFGAFLPWRPLTRLQVPPIPPHGTLTVTTAVPDDELPSESTARRDFPSRFPLLDFFLEFWHRFGAASRSRDGLEPLHFVGNLNVFLGSSKPVERHVREAIGLAPGRVNFAQFFVGDGQTDLYVFSHETSEPGWRVELHRVPWNEPVAMSHSQAILHIVPPEEARRGKVTVWVERCSTGQRVPVEFDLAVAPGPATCRQV